MAASVEATTEISISNWTAVGNSYLRPFIHYFYMPLEAKKMTQSAPYYVTLTEYGFLDESIRKNIEGRVKNILTSFKWLLLMRVK